MEDIRHKLTLLFGIFLILLGTLFVLHSCRELKDDDGPSIMHLVWEYNAPSDSVIYYEVFIYETADTSYNPFMPAVPDSADPYYGVDPDSVREYFIGNAPEDSLKLIYPDSLTEYYFVVNPNGEYICAGVSAVNAYGKSKLAWTYFIKKDYAILPRVPQKLEIFKE